MKASKLFSELQKDPKFVEAYEELALEYEIARQVMRLRIELGLTQEQLAKTAGTKQASISRLENAVGHPTVSFLKRVAAALGAELSIRFERPEEQTIQTEMVDRQYGTVYQFGCDAVALPSLEPSSQVWVAHKDWRPSVRFSRPVTLQPDATQARAEVEAA